MYEVHFLAVFSCTANIFSSIYDLLKRKSHSFSTSFFAPRVCACSRLATICVCVHHILHNLNHLKCVLQWWYISMPQRISKHCQDVKIIHFLERRLGRLNFRTLNLLSDLAVEGSNPFASYACIRTNVSFQIVNGFEWNKQTASCAFP